MHLRSTFQSFLHAGFECSTHRLRNGRRLDLVSSTAHDKFLIQDYQRLTDFGIRTVREGLRWHLIEGERGIYDFTTVELMLDAAQESGVEQIFDLFHFGWPDHLDILDQSFVCAFEEYAAQVARLLRTRGFDRPVIAPVNEISFFSWAGGDRAYMNPFEQGRGSELKRQLVLAGLKAARAVTSELPGTRLLWPEPVIHIVGDAGKAGDDEAAEAYRLSMYEAWDMLAGRLAPELGGTPQTLHMLGINFYDRNEWVNYGRTLERSEPLYRPFHAILLEVWNRYRVPMTVTETGAEDEKRPEWFAYIADEVRQAVALGVPVQGLCLYPILNHPGWDDDRHCNNGLFDYADSEGRREVYQPLAREIERQQLDLIFTEAEKDASPNTVTLAR